MANTSKFAPEMCEQAIKLCRLGAKDSDLADFFSVSEWTINSWKKLHPEFGEALREGKVVADMNVASSLYKRALGFTFTETKVISADGKTTRTETTNKEVPPDVVATIFWLKNRRPDLWRDRQEVTGKDGAPIEGDEQTQIERARRLAYLLKQQRDKANGSGETIQ